MPNKGWSHKELPPRICILPDLHWRFPAMKFRHLERVNQVLCSPLPWAKDTVLHLNETKSHPSATASCSLAVWGTCLVCDTLFHEGSALRQRRRRKWRGVQSLTAWRTKQISLNLCNYLKIISKGNVLLSSWRLLKVVAWVSQLPAPAIHSCGPLACLRVPEWSCAGIKVSESWGNTPALGQRVASFWTHADIHPSQTIWVLFTYNTLLPSFIYLLNDNLAKTLLSLPLPMCSPWLVSPNPHKPVR